MCAGPLSIPAGAVVFWRERPEVRRGAASAMNLLQFFQR